MTKPLVLVIDDSLTARMKTKELLEADGFEVIVAASGEEGTTLALEANPDVVALDVVLPGADGIEICRQWKSDPRLAELPVLLMSGERSDRDDRAAGIQAGAMGYVVKPFNIKEMLAQVHLLYRLRQTHLELKHQAALARSASTTKSRFLANMSHEIRTPLTSILGYSETLLDADLSEEDRFEGLRTILRNGTHLLEVINDILDISKIEAGKLTIERIECGFLHIISDVATLMSQRASEKGIGFSVDRVFPLPSRIVTDPTRFKQILLNLIGNAIKFTQVGSVIVKVTCDFTREKLVVEVIDTGIGMTPEQGGRLFQAFTQADDSTVREFGGTGLGLFISKDLAEKLDGSITFTSELGKGSTFRAEVATGDLSNRKLLTSPNDFTTSKFAMEKSPAKRQFKGSVLVVEDEEDIRKLLTAILNKVGIKPEVAVNGRQGMEKAMSKPFDLVFSDVQMPVMDGYALTAQLRASNYTRPIVALTGNAMETEVKRLLDVGCNEHLAKPFDKVSLYDLLSRYLVEEKADATSSSGDLRIGAIAEVISNAREDDEMLQLTLEYLRKLPGRLQGIKDLLARQSWEELSSEAHKLASAGLYGFSELHLIGSALEEAARTADLSACEKLCSEFPRIELQVSATAEELSRTP